ncbi:MAG: hypothetical protein Kow0063_23550 [Anaerolineae bacterium]
MTVGGQNYDIAEIRKLLGNAFDDPGLDSLCMDHFPNVYNKFSRGMRKDEKINLLLDHCRRSPTSFNELQRILSEEGAVSQGSEVLPTRCIALTVEGKPCRSRGLEPGDKLCPDHLERVLGGKDVKDHDGNPIPQDIAKREKRRQRLRRIKRRWFGWFSTSIGTARAQVVIGALGVAIAIICGITAWPPIQDLMFPEPTATLAPIRIPTPTPNPPPAPTATPLAGLPAGPDEFVLVVARFHRSQGYNIQQRIISAINEELDELDITNVRIVPIEEAIPPDQEYQVYKIGKDYNATAVIWGWMDRAGFTPNFTITHVPEFFPKLRLAEVPILPEETFQTYIREDLPAQMAYFTAWITAQIYFWRGQVDKASAMLDRALEEAERGNTNVGLEHVYLYRGFIEWEFRQDSEQAIIEYSDGININSTFGALYNGRGIAYAYLDRYVDAIMDYTQAIKIYEQVGDNDDYGEIDTNFISYSYAYNNRCMAYTSLGDYDQALDDCNKAIELQMGTRDVTNPFVNRGYVYWRLNDFDAALADFEAAISHDPQNLGAYLYIGRLYERFDDLEQALLWYDRAITVESISSQAHRERSQAYSERGGIYEKQGNNQAALKDYDQAILVDPDNADAYYTRGRLYEQLGRNDEALADYIQVLLIDQDEYGLVELCQRLEQCEEVVSQLQGLIGQTDEPRPVHVALGILYEELEEFEKAIREFSIALDMRATPDVYFARASAFLKADDAQAALDDYTQAIALSPWDADLYAARAGAYQKLGKLEEALEDRIQAVRIAPREIYAYDQLYELCRKIDACERVLEDFAAGLTATPFNPDIYLVLAQFSKAMGEIDQAIDYYSDFLEIDQDDIWVYEKRAELLEQLDRWAEAIDDYSTILRYRPGDTSVYRARAELYEHLEDYEAALAEYQKALEIDPVDEWSLSARASLYEKLGKPDLGTTDYVAIVAESPDVDTYYAGKLVDYCQKHGTCNQAISELSNVIEENGRQQASAYYGRGRLYEELGLFTEALDDYDYAITLEEDNQDLFFARVRVHRQSGNYVDALRDLSTILEMDSAHAPRAYMIRAEVYEELGENDQALEDYVAAIIAGSFSMDAVEKVVELCDLVGSCQATLKHFEEVVEENPEQRTAYAAIGFLQSYLGDYQSALSAFDAAIDQYSTKEIYVARAKAYIETGQYSQATKNYVLALSKGYKRDFQLANTLVETCQAGNTCREAIDLLNGWNTEEASDGLVARSLYYQSLIYAALGDAEQENQAYINLLSDYTTDKWYIYELTRRCKETNSCEMVIDRLTEAIASNAENVLLYYTRGKLHSEVGDYEAAAADFTTVIKHDPTFSQIYELRAEAYENLQMPQQAIEDYVQGMTGVNDRFGLASKVVDLCEEHDLCGFAMEALNASIANFPESARLYYARGRLHEEVNQLTEALVDYDEAIALASDEEDLFFARARVHRQLGNYTKALTDYGEILKMDSWKARQAYISRAEIYEKLGKQELALPEYVSAVLAESYFTSAVDDVARLCVELDSCADILDRLEEAVEEDPEHRAAYIAIGKISSQIQDYEAALTAFDAALELGAAKEAYSGRAGVYAERGEYLQATEDYVRALSYEGKDSALIESLIKTCQAGSTCDEAINLLNAWITDAVSESTAAKSFYFQSLIYAALGNSREENQAYVNILSDYTTDTRYAYSLLTRCKETSSCQLAINQLTTAIASNPGSEMLYYARGRLYSEQGDYQAAVADFGTVLELNPEFPGVYQLRAEAYDSLQMPREAIADYVQAIRYTSYDWLAHRIIDLSPDAFLYNFAMRSLDAAIASSPENARLYYARGRLQAEHGDLEAAADDYTQAINIDASQEAWLEARAEIYELLGNNSAALADHVQRVMIDDISTGTRGDLAQFCRRHHLCEEAVTLLSKLMEEQPENPQPVLARAEVYLTWDNKAALEDYDYAVSLAPFEAEVYRLRAKAREQARDFEGALEDFVNVLAFSESDAWTVDDMIELCRNLGNCESVVEQLTDRLTTSGATASLSFSRARLYEELGNEEMAIADFSNAIEMDDWNVSRRAYSHRAKLYEHQGNWEKAIEDYTRLIEDYRDDTIYYDRGLAYKQLGRSDLALQDLTTFLDTNSYDPRRAEAEKEIANLAPKK